MSSHQLSLLSTLPATSLPSLLPHLLSASSLSSRAPAPFAQRVCVATRLDDEATRELEEGDARWSRTRRARMERLEVCCENGECTLQLPSLALPARQAAGPSTSTPASSSSNNNSSSAGFGGLDARAAVTIRQSTSVSLLSASVSASSGAAAREEDWTAWDEDVRGAFERGGKDEAWEEEAREHYTEALFALGWRPLHTYRRHGLRFLLRDDGAKGRFEVCVYRLYHDDLSLPSPAPHTLVVHARVLHSAAAAAAASGAATGSATPTTATAAGGAHGAATATAAVLDAGMRELEALARRCAGVCVFGRDE